MKPINPSARKFFAAVLFFLMASVCAAEPVRIGVQAVRSKAQTLQQWQPLAAMLKLAVPERDFIIEPLVHGEMERAVASRQLDFVLTNPAHYVLMARRSGLSAPLATLADNDRSLPVFGGVIFTRAERTEINSLADLKGKTIAVATTDSLGGYQMQAYELLQAGVHLPGDVRLLTTGMPQDNVVEAVLAGRADAGFVRTGLLENMAREGKLKKFRVVNPQGMTGYPFAISTHLYPNWAFAALPSADENLARRVAAVLFTLEDNKIVTRAIGIHGFVVPADYSPIEEMLRALRAPPFDASPEFTLQDVWGQYRWAIVAVLTALFLALLLGMGLWRSNRSLQLEQSLVLEQRQALEESEQRYHFLFSNNPMPMWVFAEDSLKFLEVNERAIERYGFTREAFSQMTIRDIRPVEDVQKLNHILAETPDGIVTTEVRHKTKDGRYIDVIVSTMPMMFGNVKARIVLVQDITERKRAEEALRRYKDHLEEEVQMRTTDLVLARDAAEAANKAKSVFLASMSHELRTPLNAILGFSSLMQKDQLLSADQRENLDIINRSGEHLLNLINDVLEMAKIESGRTEMEMSPFDLGAMVRDVSDMMHVRAAQKGLQLLIEQVSDFPRYIRGDEARLRQVLIYLLGNAVKFTDKGGVTLRFGLKPHDAGHLLIEIEDSGIGISAEDQKRLFRPFEQLGKLAGDNQGTGLGLTISRQFVQMMGGTITVESTPGKGSIFRVELPANRVEAGDKSAIELMARKNIAGLLPGQPLHRILIVEDQLENQLLLGQLMKNIGLPYQVAENGEQAVEMFKSWQPQLIFMDRRMPVMDGVEATRRIRNLPGGRRVRIVAVTASAFMEQRDEMIHSGMDEFVRKPYRAREIYECLGRQLDLKFSYCAEDEQEKSVLTTGMLSELPQELRSELREALESLEEERIAAVIAKVPDARLRDTLMSLVENFDYPAILAALAQNYP